MTENSPMLQGGGGGYGESGTMYMVGGVSGGQGERQARQYPLEFLQYVGNATRGDPLPPGQSPHPSTRRDPPKENTAFGYESDDSSLSSNASGSNKSSEKGDNQSNTSEGSSVSVGYSNYNNGYHNHHYNYNNTREWRGRNRQHQRPRRIAPERYLNATYPFQVKFTPEDLLNGSEWDTLSQEMWDKFIKSQQTEETFRKKMNLWRYLYITIKSIFPRYGLYVVGSTMSGFGLDTSDMDLCLYVRANEQAEPRAHALLHLALILHYVRAIDPGAELIQAKVPILKFGDARLGLTVDLNCNNVVGIRNTNMLYCYSTLDWRVRPLVVVTKLWAGAHDINDARRRTLSSYSLTLMVIHFLQCGVSPPVLPCLPVRGGASERPARASCRLTLGELFLRLLHYYAHFPFGNMAISVRLGRALPAAECRPGGGRHPHHNTRLITVEEPFDLSNTASSVYEPESFERIVRAFRESYTRLATSARLVDAWPIPNARTEGRTEGKDGRTEGEDR